MHFVAPKSVLIAALSKVAPVTDRKSPQPILANVLVEAESAGLHLSATDLCQGVSCTVGIPVKRPGRVALPAKGLLDRVEIMPDGDVEVVVDGDCRATIKAVGSSRRCVLAGLPAADFPNLPRRNDDAPRFQWTAGDLRKLIRRVSFAVSADETRPHVNSMLVEITGKYLRLVATDGHRLAVADMPWQHETTATVLLPQKAVADLEKLLAQDGPADTVEMWLSGSCAFFSVAGVEFSTKTVDAQFPPYEQVIPQTSERIAVVARTALIDAVRAASVASSKGGGGVRMDFADSYVLVSAKSSDNGEASDTIDATIHGDAKGEAFFGVNFKYIIDAARAFDEDEIRIEFSSELDPVVMKDEKSGCVQVTMPMRLT